MIRFRFHVRQTGIHVQVLFEKDKRLLQSFYRDLSSFEERFVPGRGKIRQLKKTYATYNPKTCVYGLHRNLFFDLRTHLQERGVTDSEVEIHIYHAQEGAEANLELKDDVTPLEHQLPILEFTCSSTPIKVLPLQMGVGKTAIALMSCVHRKKRAAVIMGAMHIETWVKDANKFIKDTSKIKVVRGAAQLKSYIGRALAGKLDVDLFLISVNTIRDFLTEYEELGYSTYGCTPIELYQVLGIDFRIVDEVHENLHFNFRHDIETDVRDCIYMSATIESDNTLINRLYQIIYPMDRRYTGLAWDAYTDVIAVGYNINDYKNVRYKGGNGMYSHNVYEEWIIKDPTRFDNYLRLIAYLIKVGYEDVYQPGMKLLIIFSSVEMCSAASNRFSQMFPHRTHSAYNAEHEDEVLHNHDIVCSTLGSTGTGKNIYGLRTVIMTVALSNREKNIQVLGRLRKLDSMYPGVSPTFYYLVCKDIGKHVQYHISKLRLFSGLVKSMRTVNTINRI